LKAGEYIWRPEVSPSGPVVLVISLNEQLAYVYRNGIAIGVSTISSGKRGKETPTGVFTILQKSRDHRSNLYNDAPMPFMQRLTWDGIALHGGVIPGYPASHGCVRLPQAFAEKLFGITRQGDTVVVADAKASPLTLVYPSMLAPVSTVGQPISFDPEQPGYSWNAVVAPEGPVSILVSLADRRVYVMRNGILIGEAAFEIAAPDFKFKGTVLYVMAETPGREAASAVTGTGAGTVSTASAASSSLDPLTTISRAWTAYPIHSGSNDGQTPDLLDRATLPLWLPEDFSHHLSTVLVPGTTLLLTDLPAVRLPMVQDSKPASSVRSGTVPVLESDNETTTTP
jgi:hypothetical protein